MFRSPPSQETIPRKKLMDVTRQHSVPVSVLLLIISVLLIPIFPPHQLHTHLYANDAMHTAYLVNWGQSVLPTRPWDYFNIPLFDLGPGTKAFTATNPLMELLTSPLRLLGNPVLSYNLLLVLNVWFCGISAYILGYWITRKPGPAIFCGIVFAMNPWMQWHLLGGHPNITAPFLMPLAVWAYGCFRRERSIGWGWLFSLFLFLQFAASIYLGVILTLAMGFLWLLDAIRKRRDIQPKRELFFIAGVIIALGLSYALTIPYQDFADKAGQTRGVDQAILFAATPWEYLLPPRWTDKPLPLMGYMFRGLPLQPRLENVAFAGYTAILLALAGLWGSWKGKSLDPSHRRLVWLMSVVAAGAVLFSLGPLLWLGNRPSGIVLPYWYIYEYVPQLRFIRATARYCVIYLLVVAMISAVGLAVLQERFPRKGNWLLALAFVLLFAEYYPIHVSSRAEHPRAARNALAALPEDATVSPFPFTSEHWLPSAATTFPATPAGTNGGVYIYPFQQLVGHISRLPAEQAVEHLRGIGTDFLYADNQDDLRLLLTIPGTTVFAAWDSGGLVDIRNVAAPGSYARAADYPWRPPFPPVDISEDFQEWQPVRILGTDGRGEWTEYEQDIYTEGFVYRDLQDSIGLVAGGRPLGEFARVAVRFRHEKTGVDFDMARLRWITESAPLLHGAPVVRTFVDGTNEWQTVIFNLSDHPEFRPGDSLLALFIGLPTGTYPGLRVEISAIGIYGPE